MDETGDHPEMGIRIGVSLRSSYAGIDARTGARWMVEQATAARDARLDSLFVGDHHAIGSPYYQNTAVLGRLLAAWNPEVAGALFLLPLWNPVLAAEQIGTLAALTEGRFVMQCGIGAGHQQFSAMGVEVKDRRRRFEHHLAVVRALLAGEEVDGVRIAPVPTEPVDAWIGASAPAAIERAARLGDGWLGAPSLTLEQAAQQIDAYRAACDGLGRPMGAAVIRQDVHVGSSSTDAGAAAGEIVARGYRGFDPAALAVGSIAEVTDRFDRLADMGYEEISVRHLVDDQAQVLASLERLGEVRAQLSA
jgi:alkanesulfonate monooxygenase SsuD/methylene tetrahydromethanopterin reductase-like flavin-dependent oxidoreductase (luciferase family)